jgi:hypothetical protein
MMTAALVHRVGWVRLAVAAGTIVSGAVLLGWRAGNTPVPPLPPRAATPWSLPRLDADDPAKDLAVLTARHPWTSGGPGRRALGPAAAPPPPINWRLAGIITRNDVTFALIAIGRPGTPSKLEYRRVGDALPDGSILVGINSDNAVSEDKGKAKKQRVFRLFGREH